MPYCPSCGQNHAQTGGAPAARGLSYTEQLRRSANHPLSGLLTADVHAASTYAAHTAGVQPFGGLVTPDVHAASALAHLGGPAGMQSVPQAMQRANALPARTAVPMAFNAAALRAPAAARAAIPAGAQSPQKMNLPTSFDATYRDASGTPALAAPGEAVAITIPAKGVVPAGFQVSDLVTDPSSYGFVVMGVKVGRIELLKSECAFPARDGLVGSYNIGHSDVVPAANGQNSIFVQVRNILSTPAYYRGKIIGHY